MSASTLAESDCWAFDSFIYLRHLLTPIPPQRIIRAHRGVVPRGLLLRWVLVVLPDDDGANVLYADGHVEWLDNDGVTMALDKAAKWRAQAVRPKP